MTETREAPELEYRITQIDSGWEISIHGGKPASRQNCAGVIWGTEASVHRAGPEWPPETRMLQILEGTKIIATLWGRVTMKEEYPEGGEKDDTKQR